MFLAGNGTCASAGLSARPSRVGARSAATGAPSNHVECDDHGREPGGSACGSVSMSETVATPRARVLVADDEPAITALVDTMLRHAGFDVVQAQGGVEAVALARLHRPDLILLDVMMPDLDGRDACKLLKMDRALRSIPVVLISSADERDVHWRGAGADGFLRKPFDIRELPETVRRFT